ncbi:MAG: dTMP kinase [bacterium]|nr:dTMP kinase [bacterium]
MRGTFITIEGPEGSGKTVQSKLLVDSLNTIGIKTILTREPGGTKVGDDIRQILLGSADKDLSSETELFLYEAARSHHVDHVIAPNIENGINVVCDRYKECTIAYQGYAGGVSIPQIIELNSIAVKNIESDIVILIDIDPVIGLERSIKRNLLNNVNENRFEEKSIQYHTKAREGYLKIALENKDKFIIINGETALEEIHTEILNIVIDFLRGHK